VVKNRCLYMYIKIIKMKNVFRAQQSRGLWKCINNEQTSISPKTGEMMRYLICDFLEAFPNDWTRTAESTSSVGGQFDARKISRLLETERSEYLDGRIVS